MSVVDDFFASLLVDAKVDPKAVEKARAFVRLTRQEPAIALGPSGEIGITWDDGPHHLEVEVLGRQLTVFYRHRLTREAFFKEIPL